MAHIAEMGEAETAHLVDENGVRHAAPPEAAPAWDVDNRDVSDAGSYRVPCLAQRDASKDHWAAGYRSDVVVGNVVVAHGHGIGLDSRRHVEIGIRYHLGPAARVYQKARMAEPLHKIVAQAGGPPGADLDEIESLLQQPDQRGVATPLRPAPGRQQENRRKRADKAAPPHPCSPMIKSVNPIVWVSGHLQACLGRPALRHV